jgi:hypothetical protein
MRGEMDAMGVGSDGPLTESAAASREVAAAKLHVLHLDPIKAKLGAKWDRPIISCWSMKGPMS